MFYLGLKPSRRFHLSSLVPVTSVYCMISHAISSVQPKHHKNHFSSGA